MIIFTLIILVLLTFIVTVYVNNKTLSNILSVIFFSLTIGNIMLIVMNDYNHLGMKTVTEEKTIDIVSATPNKGMNMLLYQQIGTKGKENVYIYRTDKNQKKPSHTKAESYVSNKVVTDSNEVKLVRESKYRVYKSDFMKFMFGISGNDHQIVSRKNTFHINKDWLVLSTKQAKALQKKMKDKTYQATLKTEGASYVQKVVMAAMEQNPTMDEAQQKRITEDATKQFQMMKMEELIKNIKK
ncbi:DUF4811 domain-containing protein [Companilactobacillus sp. RD055328]|uniref:DUF4811 domain-containing protein n=1 Tax=Companilactobacillus sp. RD055328 TaxID=2916634 RepID=UPI001FC7D997|nr:DUF4811 domain-containing protein [Companilactobacillus sp. RD055328]GKQ42333.1 DUF4811 domain-containing protein [Companilactobacillus sp. RD055328]